MSSSEEDESTYPNAEMLGQRNFKNHSINLEAANSFYGDKYGGGSSESETSQSNSSDSGSDSDSSYSLDESTTRKRSQSGKHFSGTVDNYCRERNIHFSSSEDEKKTFCYCELEAKKYELSIKKYFCLLIHFFFR